MKNVIKKILSAATALTMTASLAFTVRAEQAEVFLPYDNFANLDFEDEQSFGHYINPEAMEGSESGDTAYELVTEGEGNRAPQSGKNAIYIGDTHFVSIWGSSTQSPNGIIPKDGDLISGTYWLKIMQEKQYKGWMQPKIRLYMCREGSKDQIDLAVTKNLNNEEGSVWKLNPYTWTQMELESTGTPYEQGCSLTWEITTTGQVDMPFMIDNVQFGIVKKYEPEEESELFGLLNFEEPDDFSGSISNLKGSVEFVQNPDQAYKGKGAIRIDQKKGGFSLWGGTKVAGAKAGSTISGTVALKLDQKKYDLTEPESNWYKFPQIIITKKTGPNENDKETLAEFDYMSVKYDELQEYTWFEADIVSTGKTFSENDEIGWNILNRDGSGSVCMIDSINLKITPPEEPTPQPDITFGTEAQSSGSTIRFVTTLSSTEETTVDGIGCRIQPEGAKNTEEAEYSGGPTITIGGAEVKYSVDLTGVPDDYKDKNITVTPFYKLAEQEFSGNVFTTTFNSSKID